MYSAWPPQPSATEEGTAGGKKAPGHFTEEQENTDLKERLYFDSELKVQNTSELSSAGTEEKCGTVEEVTACTALDGQSEEDVGLFFSKFISGCQCGCRFF